MFLPCPHCGYLVALILPAPTAGTERAVAHCPRCKGVLPLEPGAAGDAAAPTLSHDGGDVPTHAAETAIHPGTLADADLDTHTDVVSDDTFLADPAPSATLALPITSAASPSPDAPRSKPTPSFLRVTSPRRVARTTWRWGAAIAALAALLALQLLLAQRRELAADARWRPLVLSVCRVAQCTLPPWREPAAFTMLDRNVQPSRTAAGVLVVEANFRNDARWPQPWPTLVLSLSDVEGRAVGARAFAPAEYRQTRSGNLLGPGQRASARLLVREPARGVVAFSFDFH